LHIYFFFLIRVTFALGFFFFGALPPTHASFTSGVLVSSAMNLPFLPRARFASTTSSSNLS